MAISIDTVKLSGYAIESMANVPEFKTEKSQEQETFNPVDKAQESDKSQSQKQQNNLASDQERQGREVDTEEVKQAAEVVESFVSNNQQKVSFSVAEDTGKMVIHIKDVDSQEVIRQIPAEEVLELAVRIQSLTHEVGEKTGILFDQKI